MASRIAIILLVLLAACQMPQSAPAERRADPLLTHRVDAENAGDDRVAVLLHGYGSNEMDLVALAPRLGLHGDIISFRAPEPAGNGFAWFPIEFTPDGTRYGLDAADAAVERLAAELRELRSASGKAIVVVGFSQGAMLAMLLAAEHPGLVDAAIALSGTLPRRPLASPPTAPVLMAHGAADAVVPLDRARQARDWLDAAGVEVELFEVAGLKHKTSPAMLRHAKAWLDARCPPQGCGRKRQLDAQ